MDDPSVCNLFTPPLACVDLPVEQVGYEAAAMLGRMMAGEEPPPRTLWLPATHVVQRQSADLVAIDDGDVAGALRFIRDHACEGIGVVEVLAHTGLSRRMLELKFHKCLGRTPRQAIVKIKLDRAKLLLGQSDMSIETIARVCGFPSYRDFTRLFHREVGTPPRAFRRTHHFHRERPRRSDM